MSLCSPLKLMHPKRKPIDAISVDFVKWSVLEKNTHFLCVVSDLCRDVIICQNKMYTIL